MEPSTEHFILKNVPDITTFTLYKEKIGITFDTGEESEKISAQFYEKEIDDHMISCGVFSHNNQPIFCAWGYKDNTHCSMHAITDKHGIWLPPEVGCPIKQPIKQLGKIIGICIPTKTIHKKVYFFEHE